MPQADFNQKPEKPMKTLVLLLLAFAARSASAQYVSQPYAPVNPWGGYVVTQPPPQPLIIQRAPGYTTIPRPWYNPQLEHPLAYQERLQAVDIYNAQVRQRQIIEDMRYAEEYMERQRNRNRR